MTTSDASAESLGRKVRLFHNLIVQRHQMANTATKNVEQPKKRFTNLIVQPHLKDKRSDV
jgi:hypothetical protein